MADHDAQQRNLPASARKLRKARADGQVARSRDLSHFTIVATGVALLAVLAPRIALNLRDALAAALRFDVTALADGHDAIAERLGAGASLLVSIALPIGLLMTALTIAGALAAGGWSWT